MAVCTYIDEGFNVAFINPLFVAKMIHPSEYPLLRVNTTDRDYVLPLTFPFFTIKHDRRAFHVNIHLIFPFKTARLRLLLPHLGFT